MTSTPVDLSLPQEVLLALKEARLRLEAAERLATEAIAVVGLGCRFPGGAHGADAFWRLLLDGFDATGPVPADRYDIDAYHDPAPGVPGAICARQGAFLDGIDQFDAAFFGISPREAASLDPQQRLLLEVSWEALEHAGQAPEELRGSRTGVFMGLGRNDYAQRLLHGAADGLTAWHATGNGLCYGPGRLAHVLDLKGPNMAVDTACSSSLLAVHLACQSLRARECDLALAGGCHVHLSPLVGIMLSTGRALSPDGRCKTFDAAADGFGQGEGCGVVALRRLSDAVARGDTVLALIRGSAINHDGHSSGLTVPNQSAQEAVIRDALANARVRPIDVGYVEAHGTGTPLGDPIEMEALAAVLCDGRRAEDTLHVGSVKTNFGHLEAAAGVAGLIKAVLVLQHGRIPPHLHLRDPNPRIPWSSLPIAVSGQAVAWPRSTSPRFAGVSSFGMSGTNAHVVLEEPPQAPAREEGAERPLHLIALSARSRPALREQARRLADRLSEPGAPPPGDAAFTVNTGRARFPVRAGVAGESAAELARALEAVAAGRTEPGVLDEDMAEPSIVFLFPGQGSQYQAMGERLHGTQPVFRRALDRCDEVLGPYLGLPLRRLLFSDDVAGRLDQTRYTQPALFAVQYALTELWGSWGIAPAAVLGHSVGEYAAACVAGVFGPEDGLRLVAERARLMQEMPPGAMTAVAAGEGRVQAAIRDHGGTVDLAAVNGRDASVIAGPAAQVREVAEALARGGVSVRELIVSHAFHSASMEPMLARLTEVAAGLRFAPPRIGLASNVTGGFHGHAPGPGYWASHARHPVRFADNLDALAARGHRVFLEVGPGTTLLGLAGHHLAQHSPLLLPSLVRGRDDWRTMLHALGRLYEAGAPVDWAGFDRGYKRRRVSLPTYPFERQRHWLENAPAPLPRPVRPPLPPRRTIPAHQLAWHECARGTGAALAAGSWLVVDNGSGLGAALASQLGPGCVLVHDTGVFGSDPAHSTTRWAGIACLYGDAGTQDATPEAMQAVQAGHCSGVLHLAQALAAQGARGTRLWLITRGAVAAGTAAPFRPDLSGACLWGLGKGLALEHPEFWGGMIDLGPDAWDGEAADLARELTAGDPEDHVLLRGVRRFAGRVRPVAGGSGKAFAPLRADATYLVTGGLGGLGLRVAGWLVQRGARNLVLLGRHGASATAQAEVDLLRRNAVVMTVAADAAQADSMRGVLARIAASMPPLRGVVHAAGVFGDRRMAELDAAEMQSVLLPKVQGAWLLHRLTIGLPLDWFVCFSSAASLWGSKNQAHYAAANAFLDALAQYRQASGLPALSVGWGPWDTAGMATEEARRKLARVGVHALDPADAFAALERSEVWGAPHAVVADVDWAKLHNLFATGRERNLLRDVTPRQDAESDAAGPAPAAAGFAGLPAAERRERLIELVQREASAVLGLEESGWLDPQKGFFRLGMDSLMALELRNRLARAFQASLPATLAFEHPCVADLAAHLASRVLGWDEPAETPRQVARTPEAGEPPSPPTPTILGEKLARLEALVREP